MKKYIAIIVITVLASLVVFGGVAFAAGVFDKDVPATASIKATNPGLTLYSNPSCDFEITTVNFGEVSSGESSTVTAYVKNTGNKSFTNVTFTTNLDPTVGTITVEGLGPVATGQVLTTNITLTTVESTVDVNPNITITFSGTY